jgi:acyl-CoA hydrolase
VTRSPTDTTVVSPLAEHLFSGARVAIADGAGMPTTLADELTKAARSVGGIRLLLGWCLELPFALGDGAFTDVRTVMAGFALRGPVADGTASYIPTRLTAVPSLLAGPLRPDVLLISLRPVRGGWTFGTEISWMKSVIDAGVPILIHRNEALPATSETPLPGDLGPVVADAARPPVQLTTPAPNEIRGRIATLVAGLVPAGAAVQCGPDALGSAVLDALTAPVRVRSGVVSDAAARLEQRKLLIDQPTASYLLGTSDLYRWAEGRNIPAPVEVSHHPVDDGAPIVAVNSALEVDLSGQVNVEQVGGLAVSGLGGHPDFSTLATRSVGGLSVIALPSMRRGAATLVDVLSAPTSTCRSDVDIVVNENGWADLRGLSDAERAASLRRLWTVAPRRNIDEIEG